MQRILVTGGAGYLGSVLCRKLLEEGFSVRCFDRLYFGKKPIEPLLKNKRFQLVQGDILDWNSLPALLGKVNTVIHLAGIANDPTAELDPRLTRLVNFDSSVVLATLSKQQGVSRFVFASSCSVYGKALADVVNEESPVNPVSVYAESKVAAEQKILKLQDDSFCPVSLRQATLYGISPRMRIDLAINLMVYNALFKKKIFIWGQGQQWRPFLHVEDAAAAMMHVLRMPAGKISGKVYNLGATKDNFKIIDLAELVRRQIPGVSVEMIPEGPDKRSYRVDCDKIGADLQWKPRKRISQAILELADLYARKKEAEFLKPVYYNIRTVQDFIKTPALIGGDAVRPDFLPFSLPSIDEEEEQEVIRTLRSGWLTTGPKTQKFEQMLKEYVGCKHAICVSSCTAALHLSLVALGIQKGDEVITSPVTWPATANVIVHTGATPVFADVDSRTMNIDPRQIKAKITKRTKAIIPVHMAGQPCDMEAIRSLAKKHKIAVIEDAAHALGARYKNKPIGAMSELTCFSFYPIKNITTIEGGMVATNNDEWAEKIRIYSLHGVSTDAWKRYSKDAGGHHEVMFAGFKYNMPDVGAALGICQLPKLEGFIKRRKEIAMQYTNTFSQMEELTLLQVDEGVRHAHHLFIIAVNTEKLRICRDTFREALRKENIGTGIHFRSLHIQHYYKQRFKFKESDFPNAASLSQRIISLPLYPRMNQYDIDSVIKAVKKIVSYYRK